MGSANELRAALLLIALVGCSVCFYSLRAESNADSAPSPGIYIPPNEQHPAVAMPIFKKSNHGVYVSVGTERSFIGAALTGAKALFVIDYDPAAIQFANINRALLAASTGRADYVTLRLDASQDIWMKRSKRLTGIDKQTLANPVSWTFWDNKVRKNESAWDNAFKHFHTEPKQPTDPFFASDYLFDDALYGHLSKLAKQSRIWSRVLDLRHENEVRALCADLKLKGIPVGIIDTSDVPNSFENSTYVAAQYVKLFSQCSQDDTLFMNTAPAGGHGVRWSYFAFSNAMIRNHDQNTIRQWYEIEMKKISATQPLIAILDDPDAIKH